MTDILSTINRIKHKRLRLLLAARKMYFSAVEESAAGAWPSTRFIQSRGRTSPAVARDSIVWRQGATPVWQVDLCILRKRERKMPSVKYMLGWARMGNFEPFQSHAYLPRRLSRNLVTHAKRRCCPRPPLLLRILLQGVCLGIPDSFRVDATPTIHQPRFLGINLRVRGLANFRHHLWSNDGTAHTR